MDQITVATKLKTEQSFSTVFLFVTTCFISVVVLIIQDWANPSFLILLLMLCSWLFKILTDLPKQNIKEVVLDRQGIIIRRHLLRDLYLPYSKLIYVWNYTFHFRGFNLDTNIFVNQHEIIQAINVFRTQGLIRAPQRKPKLGEIIEHWAATVIIALSLLAVCMSLIYELLTGAEWLARTTVIIAMVTVVATFVVQTIYHFFLRIHNKKSMQCRG